MEEILRRLEESINDIEEILPRCKDEDLKQALAEFIKSSRAIQAACRAIESQEDLNSVLGAIADHQLTNDILQAEVLERMN